VYPGSSQGLTGSSPNRSTGSALIRVLCWFAARVKAHTEEDPDIERKDAGTLLWGTAPGKWLMGPHLATEGVQDAFWKPLLLTD
jgi:hypothetical protein